MQPAAAPPAESGDPRPFAERPVVAPAARPAPWVQLKYFSFAPAIYPAMIREASPGIPPGALVHVFDKDGRHFGQGLFNPKARVPLRMFHHGPEPVGEDGLTHLRDAALDLRLNTLGLPAQTEAFRVIHSDGDG
ncbi:MAG: class I SAM-dependent rRNA methyltransferase, partial [Limisphaerales bacterium]